jgi:hypothetical protein
MSVLTDAIELAQRNRYIKALPLFALLLPLAAQSAERLELNEAGYFSKPGLDVIVFSDIYPDGHQTGVTVIQHDRRVAANGDLRPEASPGQWSPVPAAGERSVDPDSRAIYPGADKKTPPIGGVMPVSPLPTCATRAFYAAKKSPATVRGYSLPACSILGRLPRLAAFSAFVPLCASLRNQADSGV